MEPEHIQQLTFLHSEVSKLNNRFDNQDEKLTEIYDALTGNDRLGNAGLVSRIKALEDADKRWQQLYWKGAGVMLAAWALLTAFEIFITIKFK